jgi:hypothetical protein
MNTVKINNKIVIIKDIDFSAICELEDLGLDVMKVGNKAFSSLRAAVAFHLGISLTEASQEIENHVKNGGKIDELAPLLEIIIQSDFFQNLARNTENEEN